MSVSLCIFSLFSLLHYVVSRGGRRSSSDHHGSALLSRYVSPQAFYEKDRQTDFANKNSESLGIEENKQSKNFLDAMLGARLQAKCLSSYTCGFFTKHSLFVSVGGYDDEVGFWIRDYYYVCNVKSKDNEKSLKQRENYLLDVGSSTKEERSCIL